MPDPIDTDAIRKRSASELPPSQGQVILTVTERDRLCDEVDRLRAERDALRAVVDAAAEVLRDALAVLEVARA